MLARVLRILLPGVIFLISMPAFGVRAFPPQDDAPPTRLPQLKTSSYVFAGTVQRIKRTATQGKLTVPVMRITFHVDQAFLGVRRGQTLTIHEWAGLWQEGEQYRPGERVMLFLYPPSRLGLTSPVGGGAGRFRVDSEGNVVLEPRHSSRPGLGARPRSPLKLSPAQLFRQARYGSGE